MENEITRKGIRSILLNVLYSLLLGYTNPSIICDFCGIHISMLANRHQESKKKSFLKKYACIEKKKKKPTVPI